MNLNKLYKEKFQVTKFMKKVMNFTEKTTKTINTRFVTVCAPERMIPVHGVRTA